MKRKVLVLEDEENIRSFVVLNLKRAGFEVIEAGTGEQALELFEHNPDVQVAVLDVMLPGMNGYEVCRTMRARGSRAGIIMLTARTQESDKVTGLMTGADDYVTKPFHPMEVVARVKSQLRRYTLLGSMPTEPQKPQVITIGSVMLDDESKLVEVDGEPVSLTPTEYSILKLLMSNAGQVFSTAQIYAAVWKEDAYGNDSTVAVHIRHLREKIEITPAEPRYVKVVWGQGYKFEKGGKTT